MLSEILQKIIEKDRKYLFQNYGNRRAVCFTKGKGSLLYDQDGKEYIDLFAGVAVCCLGYGHRAYTEALHRQIDSLLHSSNHFYNKEQADAGQAVAEMSFPGRTLFCNSGTEANEAAIKLARKWGLSVNKNKYTILSFSKTFHGRTFGSMTATGQKKIHDGFGPLPEGFEYLPYNDIEAFKKAVKKEDRTAAVILELVQGEGGVLPADRSFVKQMGDICREKKILVIVDEVQTGAGRTGKPFAYQNYELEPDIITMAKGLAGGIPIGAVHAKEFLNDFLPAGSHGTTFGGNLLASAAAKAVLKELRKPALQKNVEKISGLLFSTLNEMKKEISIIKDVRGMGLLIGVELTVPGSALVDAALENGLIINCTSGNVIRLAPPLNIKASQAAKGLKILKKILKEAEASK